MQLARGILAGLILLGLSGVVQAQSLTAGSSRVVTANHQQSNTGGKSRPDILFIIMDDVGIDQMSIFGYGGRTAPLTPNVDTVARAGVRFRNVWSMPECSPSRAVFFEGRYPLRTNINSAILSDDLANSQVSPYEVTTPKILKKVGYQNALFGKFHLGGPDHNPFEQSTPRVLGWDYYDGFLQGGPPPIDTSIGGQFTDTGSPNPPQSNAFWYSCGFIPNKMEAPLHGADTGACRFTDRPCSVISKDAAHPTPGFSCLQSGGIFVPNATCQSAAGVNPDFTIPNAYYVWKRVINDEQGVTPASENAPLARGYVSDQTTKSAVDWIRQQNAEGQTWMATVAYSNDHTPYQQPPRNLLPTDSSDTGGLACTGNSILNVGAMRVLSNQMIEAMDAEIGNLLVQTGLATMDSAGRLQYDPQKTTPW
jgi:hypothetical protein